MQLLRLTPVLLVLSGCGEASSSATKTKTESSSEKVADQVAELCHQVLSEAGLEPDPSLMSEEACAEKMRLIHTELSPSDWKDLQAAVRHASPAALEGLLDATLEMARSGELEE